MGVPKPILATSSKLPMSLDHQNFIQQGNAPLMKKLKSLEQIFDEIMLTARDKPVCQAIDAHRAVAAFRESRCLLFVVVPCRRTDLQPFGCGGL
jgi:hypothetical protein